MNWYDRHLLPYLIDFACGLPMVQQQRRQLVPKAHGRVLEIGMGTGQTQVVAGRDQRIVVAMLVSRYQLYDLAGDARRQGQMQLSVVAIGRGEIELQRFDDGPDGVK